MYIRDSLYNTLFWRRLPSAVTSMWTGQIAKEHRTHTVNSILESAHFLMTPPRGSWHDTRRVTVCLMYVNLAVLAGVARYHGGMHAQLAGHVHAHPESITAVEPGG